MNKARLGFIGAGWWATTSHIPVLKERDDVILSAVSRRSEEGLKKVRDSFGFEFATRDYRELLEQPLDGVIISTPHEVHYEQARAALEAGLHVLVEKPITLSASESRDLVALAKDKGLHLLVPHGWHYKDFVLEAKKQMDLGRVGRVQHIMCHMASPTRELISGDGFQMDNLGDTLFAPDLSIYSEKSRGGGYAFGQLTHSVAMMLWLTGLQPEEVFAFMSQEGGQDVDIHDAFTVRFAGGAIGAISGTAAVPAELPFQVDIRIYGSEGMLLLDVERERMVLHRHDQGDLVLEIEEGSGAYSCEGPAHQFVDLILGKTTDNYAPGSIAADTIALIEAAFLSSQNAKPQIVP